MKICIPVITNKFLESEVSEHFGKAPLHVVVESGTREVVTLIERGKSGTMECAPVGAMELCGVQAVACRGLGRGAMGKLQDAGIRVYLTDAGRVEDILWALESGELKESRMEEACAGHEGAGHEGCGHGHP